MNSGDTDWGAFSVGDGEDSMSSSIQKQEVASIKSEQAYDESNQGDDELANPLGLYDGYDSYNESSLSTDNEDLDTSLLEEELFNPDDSDRKDGMTTCEKCGFVGARHAFYSKSKRFCSISCSRSFATHQREGKPLKLSPPSAAKKGKPGAKKITQKNQSLLHSSYRGDATHIFDWGPYLTNSSFSAAPVFCFNHVPMHDSWDQMTEGVLVEVVNTDLDLPKDIKVYWMATTLKICGYKVFLRYEGFGSDGSKDFWANVLSEDVHNVGWCATYGKMLAPPKTIKDKYVDWKEFLIKRLTGTRTIPPHFYAKAQEWLRDQKLQQGMLLEVVDKMCVSAMRVAVIKDTVGCRLRLNYVDSKEENDEFWCHMGSPLIHPVGWSQSAGHKLHATPEYMNSCVTKINTHKYGMDDTTPEMLGKLKETPIDTCFQVGMKLEAIDPLNLSAICVATVTKVLRKNFLMIGIDGSMAENGSDWFCYHATSPCIFPVGFCEINHLELTPPRGSRLPFKWIDYLKQTKSMAAPVKFFDKEIPKHGFRPGMKVEAVDLMEPRLICVATVTKVVGRLLRIHFDGWEDNYDQWIDCQSPDIFPVGWCQVMKHGLEGPRSRFESNLTAIQPTVNPRKRKGKTQMYRGPRKKRSCGQDKRPPLVTKQQSPSKPSPRHLSNPSMPYDTAIYNNGLNPAFPPHKILSPEAVAANLPPLLEPDVMTSPVASSKVAEVSPVQSSDTKPPNLSPHQKVPEGFSLELAQRLQSNLFASSLSSSSSHHGGSGGGGTNHHHPLLDTPHKAGLVPHTSTTTTDTTSSMESKSNLIVSSASDQGGSTGVIVLTLSSRLRALPLGRWSLSDMVEVLKVNGCGAYASLFIKKNIDGSCLNSMPADSLTKVMTVVDGPIMRLCDLIQQVKACSATLEKNALAKKAASSSSSSS